MSLFKVEEMKCGRLDDSYAFLHQIALAYLLFALGVTLTSAPKLVPQKVVEFRLWMGSVYKISCVNVILGNISNLIDYKSFFFCSPKLPI